MKILIRDNVFPGKKKKFGDRLGRLTLPLGSEERTKGREVLRQEGKKATRHYSPSALSALFSKKQKFASATATAASAVSVPTTIDLFALSRTGPSQGIMRDAEIYFDPQISSGHDPRELLYRGSPKFFGAYFKEVPAEREGGGERGEKERETRQIVDKSIVRTVFRHQIFYEFRVGFVSEYGDGVAKGDISLH